LKTRVAGLREEMLELKYDVLKHAKCGCGVMHRYLEGNLGKILDEGKKDEGSEERDDEKTGEGEGGMEGHGEVEGGAWSFRAVWNPSILGWWVDILKGFCEHVEDDLSL
jgi:hypothetical protein